MKTRVNRRLHPNDPCADEGHLTSAVGPGDPGRAQQSERQWLTHQPRTFKANDDSTSIRAVLVRSVLNGNREAPEVKAARSQFFVDVRP